jgi:hypothetical protein
MCSKMCQRVPIWIHTQLKVQLTQDACMAKMFPVTLNIDTIMLNKINNLIVDIDVVAI